MCKFPELSIGGRLKFFLNKWQQITQDQWVLATIKEGLKLEFLTKPPFSGIRQTNVNALNLDIIQLEVNNLLQKGAIEPVPPDRFLLNIISFTKKIRGTKTSNKLETTKQVSTETTFQDGLLKQRQESRSVRRLGVINRFERCVPSCTPACSSQEVSSLLYTGEGLSVRMAMLRSNSSTEKFHENSNSDSSTSQNAKFEASSLSRRLVSSKLDQGNAYERQKQERSIS